MTQREDPTEAEGLQTMFGQCLEALFEKDRLSHLGKIVKGLIHNINGPLQNLSMLVEMVAKGQDQLDVLVVNQPHDFSEKWEAISGKQRLRFQRLIQQITLLAEILRDFMVLLEIERNQPEVDLKLILEKMTNVFHADLFFKHHVEMELRLERGLPLVAIHGRDLIPALMHVFGNAITALREAPRKKLTIECSRESANRIRIVFRDTGCGFDPEKSDDDLNSLFCSDWPETASLYDNAEKHFGLGLFTVRRLLGPYSVKFWLERDKDDTLAILLIPVPVRKPSHGQ